MPGEDDGDGGAAGPLIAAESSRELLRMLTFVPSASMSLSSSSSAYERFRCLAVRTALSSRIGGSGDGGLTDRLLGIAASESRGPERRRDPRWPSCTRTDADHTGSDLLVMVLGFLRRME